MYGKVKCGDNCGMDITPELRAILDIIEKDIKQELDITSGARCPKYNATIPGSISGDAHELGKAVDIFVDFTTTNGRELGAKIIISASKLGIKRFGIAKNFIHLDCADELPAPRVWLYY